MTCWSPRIRAARRLSELHAPDDISVPSHNRDVVSAACVPLHDKIARLVPGPLSETEQGRVASDASNISTGRIMPYSAFFFFALAFAFFPSDRGRGVTTNVLIFDFFLVL